MSRAIYRFQYIGPQDADLYENVEVVVEGDTLAAAQKQADDLVKGLKYTKRRLMAVCAYEARVNYHNQVAYGNFSAEISEAKP